MPFTDVDTTKKFRLGTRKRDVAGNEYVYGKGVASLTADEAVTIDELGQTVRLVTGAAAGPVGISKAAPTATQYGWFQIFGSCSAKVSAGFADNGLLFSTATAGTMDDAVVADSQVLGAVGRSAISGGKATVQLSYPFFGDTNGA